MTKVIHTIGGLAPDAGGPSRTVPALCEHLSRQKGNWDVRIVVGRDMRNGRMSNGLGSSVPIANKSVLKSLANGLTNSKGNGRIILHDHGQWLAINHASATLARRWGIRRIVSPLGMLSPWARGYRGWKKRIAWQLYAKRDLAQATVVHANSDLEANDLRNVGVRQPIAVIPNGVDELPQVEASLARPDRPYVLFLARIHPVKGVDELLRTWKTINTKDWELVLAGPDECGLLCDRDLPFGVRYVGPVDGNTKAQLMRQASVFVLPSYSENFGVAVAEALMAGVPVITTQGTPWQSLESEGCGWWIEMNERCLAETLLEALATPSDELQAMGRRGREFAVRSFSWPRIAAEMAEVYEWVLGGGSRPACVNVRP